MKNVLQMIQIPLVFQTKKNNFFAGVLSGFDSNAHRLFITDVRDIKKSDMNKTWNEIQRLGVTVYERVEVAASEIKDLQIIEKKRERRVNSRPRVPREQFERDALKTNYHDHQKHHNQQQQSQQHGRFSQNRLPVQQENNRYGSGRRSFNTSPRFQNQKNSASESVSGGKATSQKRNSANKTFELLTEEDKQNDYDFETKNNEFVQVCNTDTVKENDKDGQEEATATTETKTKEESTTTKKELNEQEKQFFDQISSSTMIENNRATSRRSNGSANNTIDQDQAAGSRNRRYRRFGNRNKNNAYRNFQRQSKTGIPFEDLKLQQQNAATAVAF